MKDLVEGITSWLRAKAGETSAGGAVFGLRGDIESAVVGALCKRAFGDNLRGIAITNGPGVEGENDAALVARELGVGRIMTRLDRLVGTLLEYLPPASDLAVRNLRRRAEEMVLLYHADKMDYLAAAATTADRDVPGAVAGLFDTGRMVRPIIGIPRDLLAGMAADLGVPKVILDKCAAAVGPERLGQAG